MKYTVLTYVPHRPTPPNPGQDVAAAIREVGCELCVMGYDGKLKVCWKHAHERILWGRTEEMPDEVEHIEGGDVSASSDVPQVRDATT